MNTDTLIGEGQELKGQLKSGLGDAADDPALQRDGLADQLSGKARQGVGAVRDFARDRPWAAATLAGVLGLALINGLRGKRAGR
jgi:uncharacterized protein YjbJ (UPF0337 family)